MIEFLELAILVWNLEVAILDEAAIPYLLSSGEVIFFDRCFGVSHFSLELSGSHFKGEATP